MTMNDDRDGDWYYSDIPTVVHLGFRLLDMKQTTLTVSYLVLLN